jgi:mannose-6-phosphate isomerase-like protein (cupin superfamily)
MIPIDQKTAQHYKWGDDCDGWRFLDHPQLSVIRERVPPGGCEVEHVHTQAHQFFYVLTGKATIEIGASSVSLGPEQGFHVSPGVRHRFLNKSDQDVTFLVISTPTTRNDRVDG